jgi:lipoyl synthase
MSGQRRHPDWLKVPLPGGPNYTLIKKRLRASKLHTICEEAKCPNLAECFGRGTATFLIMGNTCTRNCRYCNVAHGVPKALDPDEAKEVAESVKALNLSYVVITSVTRDDISDGGAEVFSRMIQTIRSVHPSCRVEVLIPDFKGDADALQTVLLSSPDVLNHNIEVVKRLFPTLRPQGNYETSLSLLRSSKKINDSIPTKSGFMVGLGETDEEIQMLLDDLGDAGVDMLTIGQYLQPSQKHAEVKKYYTPEEFDHLKDIALERGFKHVESGPLVRSSYHAEESLLSLSR